MKEIYEKMGTIRGTRYAIKLVKRVAGWPGFAPEYRDREVCDIVFRFPHDAPEPYVQFSDAVPILDAQDIKQISSILKRVFDEKKWDTTPTSKE